MSLTTLLALIGAATVSNVLTDWIIRLDGNTNTTKGGTR